MRANNEFKELLKGYELILDNKKYIILEVIGKGGSSIVYRGFCESEPVIIKELFPAGINITRQENGVLIIPSQDKSIIYEYIKRAMTEYEILNELRLVNNNTDIDTWFKNYHKPEEYNNTLYTVIDSEFGDMLNDMISVENRNENFGDFTEVCECILRILEALEPIHKKGYLHLDVSPDNIHVLKQAVGGKRIANLIDFNSAYNPNSKEDINRKFSMKPGYSANELIALSGTADTKAANLTPATDLYSVAVIFFELLTGRLPELMDWTRYSQNENVVSEGYLQGMSGLIITTTNQVLNKGLKKTAKYRYQSISELQEDIKELIKWSMKKELINTPQFNPAYGNFVGRTRELREIDEMLSQINYVYLSGVGGIGKSELSKKYAEEYRDKYDIIQLVSYDTDLRRTIAMNMRFRNLDEREYGEKFGGETEQYLYRDKLELLKQHDERTLLIVDNYNENDDDHFQNVIEGSYKVIFTTRSKHEQNEYQVDNVGEENLFRLFEQYYFPRVIHEEEQIDIKNLIDFVDGHTLVVELIAKTLKTNRKSPKELYDLMRKDLKESSQEKISLTKDDKLNEDILYNHISNLLDCSEIKKKRDIPK